MTIRYTWWGGAPRAVAVKESIALFEKKYPKIKVKPEFTDCEAFWEKFRTQASGGNPPDVFRNAVGFPREYDKRGVLPALRTRADAGRPSPGDFPNGVLANGQVDGRQIAVPVGAATVDLAIDLEGPRKGRGRDGVRLDRGRVRRRAADGPGQAEDYR